MTNTDPRDSNPNAAGPEGLEGDMGVSSERTGPAGGSDPADEGLQGTGTRGSAADQTEGTVSTERADVEETEIASDEGDTESEEDVASIDRTVGESNTAEVPGHPFDPSKNPGHSHG